MKIKVCGLTKYNQLQKILDLEINYLGFIFYKKSPRYVLDQLSLEDISMVDSNSKVGVFVNETISNIISITNKAKLSYIQLHGNENIDFINDLKLNLDKNIPIIKAIRIGNQSIQELQNIIDNFSNENDFLLFDTDSSAFGGTGLSFDWQILNQLHITKPYFLSGGISEENLHLIKDLIQKPFALDINSKFEIEPGIKNIEKIKNIQTQIIKLN